MSVVNGILKQPVGLKEVYDYLGAGRPTNGYNVSHLCSNSHGKTNKWAKYKPVIYKNGLFVSDPTQQGVYNANWYKSNDGQLVGNCGVKPVTLASTRSAFLKEIVKSAAKREWQYFPPTGGMNAPYRLTDFNGYNRDAICPFGQIPQDLDPYVTEGSSQNLLNLTVSWADTFIGEGALTIDDIVVNTDNNPNAISLKQWYYGVVLYNSADATSGNNGLFLTAQNPGSRIIRATAIPNDILATKEYMLPFMCNKKLDYWTVMGSDERFVAIPQDDPVPLNLTLQDNMVDAVPVARWSASSPGIVEWKIYFVNNSNNPARFYGSYNDESLPLYASKRFGPSNGETSGHDRWLRYITPATDLPTHSAIVPPRTTVEYPPQGFLGTNFYSGETCLRIMGRVQFGQVDKLIDNSVMVMKTSDMVDSNPDYIP